jgi:hypothetical protein
MPAGASIPFILVLEAVVPITPEAGNDSSPPSSFRVCDGAWATVAVNNDRCHRTVGGL